MKLKIFNIIVLSIAFCNTNGQSNLKPALLNDSGVSFMKMGFIDSGYILFHKAIKQNNVIDIEYIKSLAEIGNINDIKGKSKDAIDTLLIANNLILNNKEAQRPKVEMRLYKYLAELYSRIGYYDKSIQFIKRSNEIAKGLNDELGMAKNLSTMAGSYLRMKEYAKSIDVNKKVADLYYKLKFDIGLVNTYCNLAAAYEMFNKTDSALVYINLAEPLIEKTNNEDSKRSILNIKAVHYDKIGDTVNSKIAYRELIRKDFKDSLFNFLGNDYQGLGMMYQNHKNFDSAICNLKIAKQYFIKSEMQSELTTTLGSITSCYVSIGNIDSANHYQKEYLEANTKFFSEERAVAISNAEINYQTSIKEATILAQEVKIGADKKQKIWLFGALASLMAIISIIAIFYKKIKKQRNKIQNQRQEILHNNRNNIQQLISIFSMQAENEKDNKVLIANQERLYTLNLLNKLLYENTNNTQVSISKYVTELGNAKEISSGNKVAISIECPSITLNPNLMKDIGLIINEITTNAIKYAFTGIKEPKIQIEIIEQANILKLNINDNGNGLPDAFNIKNEFKSFGLEFIKDLVQQYNGTIKAYNNNGTRFEIELNQ